MYRLLCALFMLLCPLAATAQTMLDVSVCLEEMSDILPKISVAHELFDVTIKKEASNTIGDLVCHWEVLSEDENGATVTAKLIKNQDGAVTVMSKPCLVLSWGLKGTITLGEIIDDKVTKNLTITALITKN